MWWDGTLSHHPSQQHNIAEGWECYEWWSAIQFPVDSVCIQPRSDTDYLPCGTLLTYLWMALMCWPPRVHCLWRPHQASVHSRPHTVCHVDTSTKWMDRHRMTRASLTGGGPPDIHVMRWQQPQCGSVKSNLLPRVLYSPATRSTSKLWQSLLIWRVSLPRSAWGNSGIAWPHWKSYDLLGPQWWALQQHSRSSPSSKKGQILVIWQRCWKMYDMQCCQKYDGLILVFTCRYCNVPLSPAHVRFLHKYDEWILWLDLQVL